MIKRPLLSQQQIADVVRPTDNFLVCTSSSDQSHHERLTGWRWSTFLYFFPSSFLLRLGLWFKPLPLFFPSHRQSQLWSFPFQADVSLKRSNLVCVSVTGLERQHGRPIKNKRLALFCLPPSKTSPREPLQFTSEVIRCESTLYVLLAMGKQTSMLW